MPGCCGNQRSPTIPLVKVNHQKGSNGQTIKIVISINFTISTTRENFNDWTPDMSPFQPQQHRSDPGRKRIIIDVGIGHHSSLHQCHVEEIPPDMGSCLCRSILWRSPGHVLQHRGCLSPARRVLVCLWSGWPSLDFHLNLWAMDEFGFCNAPTCHIGRLPKQLRKW